MRFIIFSARNLLFVALTYSKVYIFANWICLAAFSLSRAALTRILWVLFKCTSSAIVAYFNIQIFMMYSGTKKVRQEDAWLLKTVIGVTASRRGLNSGKNDYNYHNSAVY